MDEYVIPIFLVSLFGTTLTLGAWFVRVLRRDFVITMWGMHKRAENPFGYWFWAIYHVAGMTLVIVMTILVTLYFLLDVLA